MTRIINPKNVYSYQQLTVDIDQLNERYPDLLTVDVIGKSVAERSIFSLKLGSGEQEIMINGAHHAREWLTTTLLMDMVETYCLAAATNKCIGAYPVKDILKQVTIYFIPMVNPDGVTLVQQGPKLFLNSCELTEWNENKDDFIDWKANIRGVDLNRQYPVDWEKIHHDPGKPSAMNFKGYLALSEPEVKAVYDFVKIHDFKIAVAYHSSGEEIFWKYKSTGEQEKYAKKIADVISNKTGYQLIYPTDNPSGGGFTDWFISYFKRPSLTIEIAPLVGSRPVPLSYYDKIWNENKEVPLELAHQLII